MPPGVPAPSFDLHGFTPDHDETRAPVLITTEGKPDQVYVAFDSPADGKCLVAQVVMVGEKPMAVVLAIGAVVKGEPEFVRAALPDAKTLKENGVTSTGTTIVAECGDPDDTGSYVASRMYHIGATSSI